MSGYSQPYVLLQFPELGDDCSILMKNPQLLPPKEITPEDVPLDDKGQPVDPQAANEAMYAVFARIIVAWKVYEAFSGGDTPDVPEDADPVALFQSLGGGDQPRLGAITVENIGRLPMVIIKRVMEELGRVVDPQ
jgi:hypothetical protein